MACCLKLTFLSVAQLVWPSIAEWGPGCELGLLRPPTTDEMYTQWLSDLNAWRTRVKRVANYSGAVYDVPSLTWTRSSFVQTQVQLTDRFLYDGRWTVDRYLDDLLRRFGGIDAVLIWATYPNLGIDNRNQFDYFRSIPGGLEALRNVTKAFHNRGVHVLWGYNPWDQSTRSEGVPHWVSLARLLKETDGDGFNGDTMAIIPQEFWEEGVAIGHPLALEPQGGGYPCKSEPWDSWAASSFTPLGWGSFFDGTSADGMTRIYNFSPGVDMLKWLDPHGRHLTHVCDRWSKNRTDAIQLAFFNGIGYEAWENVFGTFNVITDRDAELLRRSSAILRWASSKGLVQNYDAWIPHAPEVSRSTGIFSSRFEYHGEMLWLLVNRVESESHSIFTVPSEILMTHTILDLAHGVQLFPNKFGQAPVSVEALSIAAFFATKDPGDVANTMAALKTLFASPLESFSTRWNFLPQQMDPIFSSTVHERAPAGMVLLPRAKFHFETSGVEVEGGSCNPDVDPQGVCCVPDSVCTSATGSSDCQCATGSADYGVDFQFPWEDHPSRNHEQNLVLGPLYMDRNLVTNFDFQAFMESSGYKPKDPQNFLRHWLAGKPQSGDELKPVVNVGLEDARAYCKFYGKRLPHAYEWSYAAQGLDRRKYPWGQKWNPDVIPPPGHDPVKINSYPEGRSPFGVQDLVGNVWQFTDSFSDLHTRSVLLRGSSRYRPKVSDSFPAPKQFANWYFPPAFELTKHAKYLLMDASYDRAGTLGFRCAADSLGGMPAPFHFQVEVADLSRNVVQSELIL